MKEERIEGYTLEMLIDDLLWFETYLPDEDVVHRHYNEIIERCKLLFQDASQRYDILLGYNGKAIKAVRCMLEVVELLNGEAPAGTKAIVEQFLDSVQPQGDTA